MPRPDTYWMDQAERANNAKEVELSGNRAQFALMDIETFPNPNPERNYTIQHIQEEFTSTCPMTGHPDYGTVVFSYVPDQICVELKSMKLYLHSYRNKGIFFEAVTNKIFEDLYAATKPRWARLETIWRGRGGIRSNVVVEDQQESYDGVKISPFSG